jgi:ribosomal protein L37AE/L43A
MKINVNCKNCNKEFESDTRETNRGKGICCSRKCGSEHANKTRPVHKLICNNCDKDFESKNSTSKFCCTQCGIKFRGKSLNKAEIGRSGLSRKIKQLSKNIIKSCFNCGWDKSICDIHHIIEKKDGGSDEINNLTVVCPNCHRMIHRNVLKCPISVAEKLKSQELDSNPHSPT